ncbi:MAG TPA: zf-HC2 domain-containing protein [Candidatus Dormibacteraeota bacterium]|nr:zf-HC2 domain-containing protein [Candidatus Dormibacteraeota bacterium]
MKCSLLTLSCALDGELSRERQLDLDAHLVTCERCKTGMRYLREETERVSLLAAVRLAPDKATALLERSRILVSGDVHPGSEYAGVPGQAVPQPQLPAPDPFGALGIGAAILEAAPEPDPGSVPATDDSPERPPSAVIPEAETVTEAVTEESELEQGSAFEAEQADLSSADAFAAVPEVLWLMDTPEEPAAEDPTESPGAAGLPVPREPSDIFSGPAEPSPSAEPSAIPDHEPETVSRPSSMVVPGWEPATELKMPWEDIPSAAPAHDTWTPELAGVPVSRESPLPPPAPFPAAPPARPAAAAVPKLQSDPKRPGFDRGIPKGTAGGGRRPVPPKPGSNGAEPRSWTRTGLIAVAALAVVLILWNITHGPGQKAVPPPRGQASPAATATPRPSATATPSTTAPQLTLTGTQTLGSGGTGYQVQSVQYGVHGSQFWVVIHFTGGTGVPTITSGFDGAQTIYLEMQGVAPGTAVAQPAAGSLVSSVEVGHVAGFKGAVYVLQLSRAAQISPSELTGSEAGAPGYLAIIQ